MSFRTTMILSAFFLSSGSIAGAATLSSLVAGTSLTQGDVTFSNFFFDDRFGVDDTGGEVDRTDTTFLGDRSVSASQIEITTSATAETVSLTVAIDPSISIADAESPDLDHIFDFFLDFSVSVSGTSSRQITGVTLGAGDLFATGDGVSEVIYDILDLGGSSDLEIFEAPQLTPASQTSQTQGLIATSLLNFKGQIEGNTAAGATAGLSTFSLTLNLQGDTPPPSVVPLPATLPLLLAGLFAFGLARRKCHAA